MIFPANVYKPLTVQSDSVINQEVPTLKLLDTEVVTGSAGSSITLDVSGAPSNTRAIRIVGHVNHGEAGTGRDFLMLPNGDLSVTACSYNTDQNAVDTQFNRPNHLIAFTGLDFISFTADIETSFTIESQTHRRRIRSEGQIDDNPNGATTASKMESGSFWNNTADALASVEVRSTTGSGPGTLQTSLGVGSVFQAYAVLDTEA